MAGEWVQGTRRNSMPATPIFTSASFSKALQGGGRGGVGEGRGQGGNRGRGEEERRRR